MENIYSRAKTAGYKAQDVIHEQLRQFLEGLEDEFGRDLTEDEESDAVEGFWNGVV